MTWPNPHEVRRALVQLALPVVAVFALGAVAGAAVAVAACRLTGGCR